MDQSSLSSLLSLITESNINIRSILQRVSPTHCLYTVYPTWPPTAIFRISINFQFEIRMDFGHELADSTNWIHLMNFRPSSNIYRTGGGDPVNPQNKGYGGHVKRSRNYLFNFSGAIIGGGGGRLLLCKAVSPSACLGNLTDPEIHRFVLVSKECWMAVHFEWNP